MLYVLKSNSDRQTDGLMPDAAVEYVRERVKFCLPACICVQMPQQDSADLSAETSFTVCNRRHDNTRWRLLFSIVLQTDCASVLLIYFLPTNKNCHHIWLTSLRSFLTCMLECSTIIREVTFVAVTSIIILHIQLKTILMAQAS